MSSDRKKGPATARIDVHRLWERSREAFEVGDYATARRLDRQILDEAPDHELAERARRDLERFRTGPVAVKAGLASLVVYLLAWVYALS